MTALGALRHLIVLYFREGTVGGQHIYNRLLSAGETDLKYDLKRVLSAIGCICTVKQKYHLNKIND